MSADRLKPVSRGASQVSAAAIAISPKMPPDAPMATTLALCPRAETMFPVMPLATKQVIIQPGPSVSSMALPMIRSA